MTIIDFQKAKQDREPHTSGEAVCVFCQHKWQAVAPVGTTDLECPECQRNGGVWLFHFMPAEGDMFVCNCGNFLFILQSTGRKLCVGCGVFSDWGG